MHNCLSTMYHLDCSNATVFLLIMWLWGLRIRKVTSLKHYLPDETTRKHNLNSSLVAVLICYVKEKNLQNTSVIIKWNNCCFYKLHMKIFWINTGLLLNRYQSFFHIMSLQHLPSGVKLTTAKTNQPHFKPLVRRRIFGAV